MLGGKTLGELVAELRMERAAFPRCVVVIVEGVSDRLFWQKFLRGDVRVLEALSKSCALGIARSHDRDIVPGAVIVDDDYDFLLESAILHPLVCYLGVHDLEALLVRSACLRHVLAEYCASGSLERFEARVGSEAREILVSQALPLGRLRYQLHRVGAAVSFADFTIMSVVKREDVRVQAGQVVAFLEKQGLDNARMIVESVEWGDVEDPWPYLHGDDLLGLLCILISVVGGKSGTISRKELARALRLSFSRSDLDDCKAVSHLRAIEQETGRSFL